MTSDVPAGPAPGEPPPDEADISRALLASLAERRDERNQLDRIERKLNALCKAIGGPLRDLDLSEPR